VKIMARICTILRGYINEHYEVGQKEQKVGEGGAAEKFFRFRERKITRSLDAIHDEQREYDVEVEATDNEVIRHQSPELWIRMDLYMKLGGDQLPGEEQSVEVQ
jgi:hypothetical protein